MLAPIVKEYIERSVLCWLATVDGDQPSVSPKEIFTHYGDDTLIIANIASSQSAKNIKSTHKVCVCFVDIFAQKGYQIYGVGKLCRASSETDKDKLAILQTIAGDRFAIKSFIDIKAQRTNEILAPSYRFYKDTSEADMIENALKTYGVRRD